MGWQSIPLARPPRIHGYQPTSEPVERTPPQGGSVIAPPQGQSNTALLALMKTVEYKQAEQDMMLLVPYDRLEWA